MDRQAGKTVYLFAAFLASPLTCLALPAHEDGHVIRDLFNCRDLEQHLQQPLLLTLGLFLVVASHFGDILLETSCQGVTGTLSVTLGLRQRRSLRQS